MNDFDIKGLQSQVIQERVSLKKKQKTNIGCVCNTCHIRPGLKG